jgi:hypothetical protein
MIAIAACAAGSTRAKAAVAKLFDDLYSCHAGSVHRFCLSQVGDAALAEDLTHETFARAFAAHERVSPDPATVPLSVNDAGRIWLAADDGAIWLYRPDAGLEQVAKVSTSTRGAPGVAVSGPCR